MAHASDYKKKPRFNSPKPNPRATHFVFIDIPALAESSQQET